VVESLIPLAACALYVGFFHAANTWFPALARRVRTWFPQAVRRG
jgi:hypothetical protein